MKEKIKKLLILNSKYRKSDSVLMARIWHDNLVYKIDTMSAVDLLNELAKGNLTNWETATRIRRDLQSKDPTLRDPDIYEKRKDLELEYRMNYSHPDSL